MLYIVYILKNYCNEKVYIGQTSQTLDKRWKSGYKGCTHIYNAINKYGKNNFYYEILTICGMQETSDYWETYFINKYNSANEKYGYNLRIGGSANGKASQKTIQKLSESHKGHKHSEKTKQKMSDAKIGKPPNNKGKKRSDIANQKLSNSISGEKHHFYGKEFSPEHKQRLSDSHLGQEPTNKKITNEIAEEIRRLYATDKYTYNMLAKMYGVSEQTIYRIIKNKSHKLA